jgi:hypothetical protein
MIAARILATAAILMIAVPAASQTASEVRAPSGYAPMMAPCVRQSDRRCVAASDDAPIPIKAVPRTEAIQLISAGVSAGAQTLMGGRYAFAQGCLNYRGQSVSLRYRGPDGTTMQTAATKSSADTSLVEVPAGAVIDATVPSAAIGCNASMTRIPQ